MTDQYGGGLVADDEPTSRSSTATGSDSDRKEQSSSVREQLQVDAAMQSPSKLNYGTCTTTTCTSTLDSEKASSATPASDKSAASSPSHLGKEESEVPSTELGSSTSRCSESRRTKPMQRIAQLIVGMSLVLDICLITALVPIAPAFLDVDSYLQMGLLFGANSGVQVVTNFFLGRIVDRYGPSYPLFFGLMAMCATTTLLAFAGDISYKHRYEVVMSTRGLQGLSTACATTGGLAWLATLFPDEEQRGAALGKAMAAMGFGALVGPPFGAAFTPLGVENGWRYPFLILAFLCVLTAALQAALMWSRLPYFETVNSNRDGSLKELARDPYIVFGFVFSFFCNAVLSVFEATLPTRLERIFDPSGWELGVIFVPHLFPYIIITPIAGRYLVRVGRHWGIIIGSICLGAGSISVPLLADSFTVYSHGLWILSAPMVVSGVGLALVDSTIMPLIVTVVEQRHTSMPGSSCAVITASVSLAYFLGPIGGSYCVDLVGFKWAYIGLGVIICLLMPFSFKYKHFHVSAEVGSDEERKMLLE